uniref:Signal recognition particle receptor subunit beta n=1 Tax=Haptolina brevifila TaxID=156173 RepID=A0A7S2I9C4_9EUKA
MDPSKPVEVKITHPESVAMPLPPPMSPSSLTPPVLLLSLLLPLLLAFLFLRRGKKSGRKLVIFGPVGGGKTAIYHWLRFGRIIPTVSSMQPTSASFVPSGSMASGNRPTLVVDVPGSGRLRSTLLEEASSAAALVCVIDATQLVTQARDAAGMLFEVLSHDPVARRQPPVLIAVNKQDCIGAATNAAARKTIEQEVERVRLARTTMEDTSGRTKQVRGIADDSQGAFSFDHLANKVTFAATSATKLQLTPLLELIADIR